MRDLQPCSRCFSTAVVDCLSKNGQVLKVCRSCFVRAIETGEVHR